MISWTTRSAFSRSCRTAVAATRSFSTAAPTEAKHRPVLTLYGLAARYANATYVAASKTGTLDKVEAELMSLHSAAQTSKQFASLLENPLISRQAKTTYVSGLDKLQPITRNLLITMAGNARLNELPKVAATFQRLMKAKRGEVDARIITAEPLTPDQLKEVRAAVQSRAAAGTSVIIQAVTDPSIVGGLQVQIGDQFLDLSVKSRIEEFARMNVD